MPGEQSLTERRCPDCNASNIPTRDICYMCGSRLDSTGADDASSVSAGKAERFDTTYFSPPDSWATETLPDGTTALRCNQLLRFFKQGSGVFGLAVIGSCMLGWNIYKAIQKGIGGNFVHLSEIGLAFTLLVTLIGVLWVLFGHDELHIRKGQISHIQEFGPFSRRREIISSNAVLQVVQKEYWARTGKRIRSTLWMRDSNQAFSLDSESSATGATTVQLALYLESLTGWPIYYEN